VTKWTGEPRGDYLARMRVQRKNYRARHPERVCAQIRDWYLRSNYGITSADYTERLHAQGGVCAACGRQPGPKQLCVDHDHGTGAVRGLLCDQCNRAVGLLQDSAAVAEQLARYLGRAEACSTPN
jgi:hypothetical protein